jgi:lipopolysaccharide export system permease protein
MPALLRAIHITHRKPVLIVFRYLLREVLGTTFAVSMVLLLIVMSARFIKYLAKAAAGGLDGGVLLQLMLYRLPGFLELIIPLGFFLGVLLAYGRLHIDNEMTVLSACGMSEKQLLGYTVTASVLVALMVALFSLLLGPKGANAAQALLAEQSARTEFETLKPMRFHELSENAGVTYAESISEDRKQLRKVFMATTSETGKDQVSILTAATGETVIDSQSGKKFLLLRDGRRYTGQPGAVDYQIVEFETWSQALPEPDFEEIKVKNPIDGLSTRELYNNPTQQNFAALQWRFSIPVLVLVVGLLAVPMSKTEPRMGRYSRLFPAVLLYFFYLVAIYSARGRLEEGNAPHDAILWIVHASFLFLAVFMINWRSLLVLLQGRGPEVQASA